jgi:hypothetical protein
MAVAQWQSSWLRIRPLISVTDGCLASGPLKARVPDERCPKYRRLVVLNGEHGKLVGKQEPRSYSRGFESRLFMVGLPYDRSLGGSKMERPWDAWMKPTVTCVFCAGIGIRHNGYYEYPCGHCRGRGLLPRPQQPIDYHDFVAFLDQQQHEVHQMQEDQKIHPEYIRGMQEMLQRFYKQFIHPF